MSKGFSNLYDGTKGSRKYPSFDKNIKKTSDSYPLTKSGYFGTEGSSTSRRIIKTKTPYKDARDFFDKLVKGFDRKPLKKDKTEKNNQQTVVLPDGTRINKRIRTSTKGSPAIDIFITKNTSSGLKQQKIHFIKENTNMKIYKNQLTDEMVSRMALLIGQTFKKYVARKSQYSDEAEIPLETGLFFTNDCFILKNDYIGCDFVKSDEVEEEYNIFTLENMENNEYVSHSKDVILYDFPVKEKIVDIRITTDAIHCFNKEFDEEFITDVAITFCLETCNITFYRSAWFSPYIDIEKTNVDTISEMPSMSDSTEAFSSSMYETNITRTVKSVDKSQGLLF